MYYLLFIHSILRWLLLTTLLWAIFAAWKGWQGQQPFRRSDRVAVRAASITSQVQLLVGFALYFWSPVAQGFWGARPPGWSDSLFFGLVHFGLMTLAIILLTIGSALAKREADDRRKFRVVLNYYGLALFIILVAIPWPFSPLAQRPWLRVF